MSSRRSYHDVFAQTYIVEEIKKGKGTQFDPDFADIMLAVISEDKEYTMREQISEEKTEDVKEEAVAGENVFGFLAMLEAGGLTTAIGMKYCMNDIDFYVEMLDEFVQMADERIDKLTRSLENRDLEKYRITVHSLKSASRTIGAEKLSEDAKALEDAAKNGDIGFILSHNDDLIGELKSIVSGILMSTSMYRQ